MKAFAGFVAPVAVLCAGAVLLVSAHSADAGARGCYSFWAEAEKMGSRYRHIVYVENDCDHWLQCSLWTDANPQPPKMITVGPDATEHAETTGTSDYDDPRAFGTCHRK